MPRRWERGTKTAPGRTEVVLASVTGQWLLVVESCGYSLLEAGRCEGVDGVDGVDACEEGTGDESWSLGDVGRSLSSFSPPICCSAESAAILRAEG